MMGPRIGPRSLKTGGYYPLGGDSAAPPTLSVVLADSADPVATSAAFNYTVVLTVSVSTAANVSVAVTLPASVTFGSASGTGWTCNHAAGVVTCTRSGAAIGAAPTITISVTAGAASLSASASVTADATGAIQATDSETTQVGAPLDATSGKGVPLTLADYALVTSKVPTHTWAMQDASGNPAATVGTGLTKTGVSVTYQQAVTGWARKAIRIPEISSSRLCFTTAGPMNPASGSVAWFGYIDITATPAGTSPVITGSNNATLLQAQCTTGPLSSLRCAANSNQGTGNPVTAGVIPFLLVYNKTASTVKLYTSQDLITGTYNSGVGDGTVKGFGSAGTPTGFDVLLGAGFEGAEAEFSDAQARAFLTAIVWTIPW